MLFTGFIRFPMLFLGFHRFSYASHRLFMSFPMRFLGFLSFPKNQDKNALHFSTDCDAIKHASDFITYELCGTCLKSSSRLIVTKEA